MLNCYVLLDLETTGGNALHDRITEVAAVRIENGVEVARLDTLVNPRQTIPVFIEHLTGISNAAVQQAPSFDEVAPALLRLLEDAVLVAHNVRFDHAFLIQEFSRLGTKLRSRTLCTVRLSRRLYPNEKRHGLDAIMLRYGLQTQARHRAMGDVMVVQAWLAIARNEWGLAALQEHAQALLQSSAALPPQLETDVQTIPESPGVYLFYGDGEQALYIGKSIKLRSRIMSHFQASSREPREMRIAQEIRRIEWIPSAGELGALLLEARLVKARQPLHNRQLRRENSLCAWRLDKRASSRPLLSLVRGTDFEPQALGELYGPYRSRQQALTHLRTLADIHQLCHHAIGLSSGKGPCFAHQIKRCLGVCCGQETPEHHHLRVRAALAAGQLQAWPFSGPVGLRETDVRSDRSEVHVFDQWCHLGSAHSDEALRSLLQHPRQALAFDLDSYRLALKYLVTSPKPEIERVDLRPWC